MRKCYVMRISRAQLKAKARIGLAACVVALAAGMVGAAQPEFTSPEAALKQGLGAYRGGYYEIAIPALTYAADEDSLLAKYYLALIYSDNLGSRTDHVKAFKIFRSIVDEYAEVDPDMDPRASIVGRALTAYAKYVRRGLSEINLKPNPERATDYLNNASMTFNDEDAQFELAKMFLAGEGVPRNLRLARHWLSVLSEKGHPGAQAFLADLLWRGKYMKADPVRALALIVVAVKHAPPQERLWIEDIYQAIYCGAPNGVRQQATGIVADWGKRYGRKTELRGGYRAMRVDARPVRTCQDGEYVGSMLDDAADSHGSAAPVTSEGDRRLPAASMKPQSNTGFSYGGAAPPVQSLRDVSTPDARR